MPFRSNTFGNTGGAFAAGLGRAEGAVRGYLGSSVHKGAMNWTKEAFGLRKGMGMLGRGLGLGYLAYSGISGYQEGGMVGAAKSVASEGAMMYGMHLGWQALKGLAGGAATIGAIGVAGAAIGGAAYYGATGTTPWQALARPQVREHMRKHAKLEMGRPMVDQFGTAATMRQRSLAAIQRSKINGRSAIGNEATLTYRPYFR